MSLRDLPLRTCETRQYKDLNPRVNTLLRSLRALLMLAVLVPCAFAVLDSASPESYLHNVRILASPAMEGRGAGTKGLKHASHYIERQFKALNLRPAGDRKFFQPFTVTTGARLVGKNRLSVRLNGSEKVLKLGEDYLPLSFSSVGSISGPLVFAGYGASADELEYNDYAGLHVKDKIVIVLRYEPKLFEQKSGNQGRTQHSHLIIKAINARNHGARAVIVVNGNLSQKEQDVLIRFGSLAGPEDAGIPIVQVKNTVVEEWLKPTGNSLSGLQDTIDTELKPQSFPLPDSTQVSLTINVAKTHATAANVLAYLPGRSDEYVVIGAHYDHLGRGDANSLAPSQIGQIHPGADDNASGTAGLLELAKIFSRQRPLERGILFAAFSGEELGLLGSAYWVNHPTLPLDKAVAMINMDMIGRVKDFRLFIGGIGTGSTFKPLVENVSNKYKFKITYSAGGYSASDHTSFVAKKIPVLFFFSGLHSDYHKPSDTWEKIDAKSAAQIVDFVGEVVTAIDNAENRPQFLVVESEMRTAGTSGEGRGYGPYFGSIPDFAESEHGVKFADIRPGSPAAKAGLRAGDVLVQFADKTINNLYDFTDALRRSKVGDVVLVRVLREGKLVSADVTLVQRK